jgi:ABC-type polysaccharide/polyol phosphate export permease
VLILTIEIVLAMSASNVIYRDEWQLISLTLLLWFYFSPMVYSLDLVAEPVARGLSSAQ